MCVCVQFVDLDRNNETHPAESWDGANGSSFS